LSSAAPCRFEKVSAVDFRQQPKKFEWNGGLGGSASMNARLRMFMCGMEVWTNICQKRSQKSSHRNVGAHFIPFLTWVTPVPGFCAGNKSSTSTYPLKLMNRGWKLSNKPEKPSQSASFFSACTPFSSLVDSFFVTFPDTFP
jgi:hypothetical protein